MNKLIGIRFLLQYGQFLQVILPEDKARQYVTDFANRNLTGFLSGHDLNGSWAIRSDMLVGMHTIPIDPNQLYQMQRGVGSGL